MPALLVASQEGLIGWDTDDIPRGEAGQQLRDNLRELREHWAERSEFIVQQLNLEAPSNEIPLWQLAQEIAATVPDSEWAKLPTDLATNLDTYLYGREQEEPN